MQFHQLLVLAFAGLSLAAPEIEKRQCPTDGISCGNDAQCQQYGWAFCSNGFCC